MGLTRPSVSASDRNLIKFQLHLLLMAAAATDGDASSMTVVSLSLLPSDCTVRLNVLQYYVLCVD